MKTEETTDRYGACYRVLRETSRTFYIPIMGLTGELRDAVAGGYLCLRAIDEVEDDTHMPAAVKAGLLDEIARVFGARDRPLDRARLERALSVQAAYLPEVSRCLDQFAHMTPAPVQPVVWRYTADMADSMAGWVRRQWALSTVSDLDQYTFDVAGRVGLMLSDLWLHYEGVRCDEALAVGFGRALQAVNIVRNRDEDLVRGVDFFPDGWSREDMVAYARRQIVFAEAYMEQLGPGVVRRFCQIPLALAKATLHTIAAGGEKLSREDVMRVIAAL